MTHSLSAVLLKDVELNCPSIEKWFYQNTNIKTVFIGKEVRTIGESAFEGCTGLVDLTFSNGVETIGEKAFSDCINLKSIDFPDSVTSIGYESFCSCNKLSEIHIPGKLTHIGDFAFFGRLSLNRIQVDEANPVYDSRENCNAIIETASNKLIRGSNNTFIPNSIEIIEVYAFAGCNKLTSFTISRNIKSIGFGALWCRFRNSLQVDPENPIYDSRDGCNAIIETATNKLVVGCKETKIPSSVEEIGDGAFGFCMELTEITFPENILKIGKSAFYSCEALQSVTIHDYFTSINKSAFNGCISLPVEDNARYLGNFLLEIVDKSLTECKIREDTHFIFGEAFSKCDKLVSIDIPDSVVEMGAEAFFGCSSLEDVRLPNSIKRIRDNTFYCCSALKSIVIPDSVTSIGCSAFEDCKSLQSVRLSDNLKVIEADAFSGCHSLTSVHLPSQLKELWSRAFKDCTSLKEIIIPENVKTIDGKSFYGCSSLTSIVLGNNVEKIGGSAFSYTALASVLLPNSLLQMCENAFAHCDNLKSITIPEKTESIGYGVFQDCRNLEVIHIKVKNPAVADQKVGENSWYYESKEGKTCICENSQIFIHSKAFDGIDFENVVLYIPAESETAYKKHPAFQKFKTIKTGNVLEKTGNILDTSVLFSFENDGKTICGLFDQQSSSIVIPDTVVRIDNIAFSGCSELENITIPASIKIVGQDAFKNCTNLREIHIQIAMPNKLVIRANEFKGVDFDSCILFVPRGCQDAYHSHPAFCQFKDIRVDN